MVVLTPPVENAANAGSSDSSLSSFVVLRNETASGIYDSHNGTSITSPPNGRSPVTSLNETVSLLANSLGDMTLEEIQDKLAAMLNENAHLKETLHQNNLAMRQQFNTLSVWQNEVSKTHKQHQEKFEETRQLVLKLRKENSELKSLIKETEKGKRVDDEIPTMSAVSNDQVAPSRNEQLIQLVDQLTNKLQASEAKLRQQSIEVERLGRWKTRTEEEINAMKRERDNLKSENDKLLLEKWGLLAQAGIREQIDKSETTTTDVTSIPAVSSVEYVASDPDLDEFTHVVAVAGDEMVSSTREHESTVDEAAEKKNQAIPMSRLENITRLQQELEEEHEYRLRAEREVQQLTERCRTAEEQLENNRRELEATNRELQTVNVEMEVRQRESNNRNTSTTNVGESAHTSAEERIRDVMQESYRSISGRVEQMQSIVMNEEETKGLKEELTKLRQLLEEERNKSKSEIDSVLGNLQIDSQAIAYHDAQVRALRKQVDELTAQVVSVEQELADKNQEIELHKTNITTLSEENEMVVALKTQAEVYRTDFEQERVARENLVGEKNELTNQNQELHQRIAQLNAQLQNSLSREALDRERNIDVFQEPVNMTATAPIPSLQPTTTGPYTCPRCQIQYQEIQALENHVERCLDENNDSMWFYGERSNVGS